jgi:beta-glucosidase
MKNPPLLLIAYAALALVPRVGHAQALAPDARPIYQDPAASAEARVEDLLQRLTPDEKIKMLGGTGFTTQAIGRLGVPAFQMSDASCGVRYQIPSPAYTASVCLAASWDAALAQKVGASLGRDCRARGVNFLLGPGVNLYRAPMCGRNFEYLGEDPLLAGEMAGAFIRGVQSQKVAATLKHFVANNQEFNRHNISSDADERTLRELYLRTFQIALREGQPKCVMNSYNPINGVHASQNRWLLTDVLKGEFGFRGLVMSDWASSYDTLGMANAGLDLEMPVAGWYKAEKLQPLLADGRVTMQPIDDKIRRQLRVAFELGWFDRPQADPAISKDDPASYAVNLEEAREGISLLKNTGGLLPLDPAQARRVLVIGPNSDHPVTGGGGSAFVRYAHAVSVLDALQHAAQPGAVSRLDWEPGELRPADGEAGVQAVRDAEAVVVCVGFDDPSIDGGDHGAADEREGRDRQYVLPNGQVDLITTLAKLNPHIVVVLNAGGSVETASWIEHVPVLLHAFYPGSEGNRALAEIVFGQTNPSGKLPFSWEKRWQDCAAYGNYPDKEHPTSNTYKEGVFLGYRWFDAQNKEPLFPFGFGLSYTQFALSDLKAARSGGDEVEVSAAVRNTGARAGAEVVEIYAAPPAGALPRPPRELKAFARVFLQAGETKTVSVKVKLADLAAWDPGEKKWMVFPGEYVFQAGDSSRDLPLRAALTL